MKLLVTGITGKVGFNFLPAFLDEERFADWSIRAICNNRTITHPAVEVLRASLSDAAAMQSAMAGVTHVLHMAAVKERPDLAMDVGVKGMFNLLEVLASREEAVSLKEISEKTGLHPSTINIVDCDQVDRWQILVTIWTERHWSPCLIGVGL